MMFFEEVKVQPSGIQCILKNGLIQEIFDHLGADGDLSLGVIKFVEKVIEAFDKMFGTEKVFRGFVYSVEKEHKSFHLHLFLMFKIDFDFTLALQ